MKADKDIITLLQDQYTIEVYSSLQYMDQAAAVQKKGFDKLAQVLFAESAEEREHAEKISKRLYYFESNPGTLKVIVPPASEEVHQIFQDVLDLEKRTQEHLQECITTAEAAQDYISRDLFVELLKPTEDQIYAMEAQLKLKDILGVQNWLQTWV